MLNSQSDSIVVVKQNQSLERQEQQELEVTFCNSKSIELFGVDLTRESSRDDLYKAEQREKAKMMLEMPRFVRSVERSPRSDTKNRMKTERNGIGSGRNFPNEMTHSTGADYSKMSL